MKVAELSSQVTGNERSITTELGRVRVSDDGSSLQIRDEAEYPLDGVAEATLARFLGINRTYLAKCPGQLKAHNINHWLSSQPVGEVTLDVNNYGLLSIHSSDQITIPLDGVVQVLERVCKPEWDVVDLRRDDKMFTVDITTPHQIEVPGDSRIEGRPAVGDITRGGMRVTSGRLMTYPSESIVPSVTSYLHRLWCSNGSSSPTAEGTVRLKGSTVPEILAELEEKAQEVLSGLDQKLADYAAMANQAIPGNPSAFARQIGNEYMVPHRILNQILDRTDLLPEDASLYDVQNIFTEVANGSIRFETRRLLQGVGGLMAFNTEHIVHRCNQCERVLPD